MTGILHPLADAIVDGCVITETRAPVVFLTAARVNLLASARDAGASVVLVSDDRSSLTPALSEVWRLAGAGWAVRSADGSLRDGFSGKRLASLTEAAAPGRVSSIDDVSLDFLRSEPANELEFIVNVSLRHRARSTTVLGGPAEEFSAVASGAPPLSWGAFEPTGSRWDRAALTAFAKELLPRETFVVATGEGFSATVRARRTTHGVEEITQAHVGIGAPSTLDFEKKRAEVVGMLGRLAATSMPLVGLVMVRPGRRDGLLAPVLQHPPTPLALLVGPPGVKSLDVPVEAMTREFGAIAVGKPRIPGLLFELGTLGEPTWQKLDAILAAIGADKLASALGDQADFLHTASQGGTGGQ